MLVLRRLISHDEGQAGLAHKYLAICESVSRRCIEFSDCVEDYVQSKLMHFSDPVFNPSF
jgi:hypothetical protein